MSKDKRDNISEFIKTPLFKLIMFIVGSFALILWFILGQIYNDFVSIRTQVENNKSNNIKEDVKLDNIEKVLVDIKDILKERK